MNKSMRYRIFALLLVLIFFGALAIFKVSPIKAQSVSSIIINPGGSITGTTAIVQSGNIYTFIANITGNLEVQTSNIVINGSGYWLNGNGGVGFDINDLNSYATVSVTNITIENLYVDNCAFGISSDGGSRNNFFDDEFSNCSSGAAIRLMDCSYNNISYCNFDNESQISMDYSANFNLVTECNLPPYGVLVWISGSETVDRNYWSDYLTKYSNATEVDHSGVGDQAYVYYSVQNISPDGTKTTITYQDNHPLMKPVAIPLMGSKPQTKISEFSSMLLIGPLLLSMLPIAMLLRHRKTSNLRK